MQNQIDNDIAEIVRALQKIGNNLSGLGALLNNLADDINQLNIKLRPLLLELNQLRVRVKECDNLIEETNVAGSLIEVSLTITNTNFNVYLKVDGEMLLTGKSFTELMSLSRDLAWLTAIQDPNTSEYWLQIAGIEWKREFVLTIEPNEEITFYNISWSYIKYLG